MKHSDGQTRDFQFSNIKTDSTLPDSLFKFTPPPGVRVLEGIGR
jgi:outer membrane lipoprotein-sorting protein